MELAKVVWYDEKENLLFPDSLVGTDSHTTMINGLSVLGWGVGGIEAEAVMLGEAISMSPPKVVGVYLHGQLINNTTPTDLVLTITKSSKVLWTRIKYLKLSEEFQYLNTVLLVDFFQ